MKFFLILSLIFCLSRYSSAEVKKDIVYAQAGDVSLLLDAGVPGGAGLHPVAILVHGGGWSGGDKSTDFAWLRGPLTRAGFTWFSINYRLAPKYRWPACYDDVQNAIRWVKQNAARYKGDPNRIALIGYSAGGQLVCLAAVRATPATRVQAVVGYAPPTDLELDLSRRGGLSPSLQKLLDRPHVLNPKSRQMLRDISAINFVHPDLPPFLLIHGTADKSVPYQGSINFENALKKNGVSCELITMQAAPHNSAKWDHFDKTYTAKTIAWLEKTLAAPAAGPAKFDATVSTDGSGDYRTVQDAINASPQSNPLKPWFIHVKPGVYHELIYVQREKRLVHLVGDDPDKTIITFGLYANMPGADGKPMGTFRTPTAVIDADKFTVENITFANSAGPKGQALAIRINGDQDIFRNCRFLGWQDTIFGDRGRHYFQDCSITGATDFIFGGATEYFDHCQIICVGKGYITAASTPESQPFGFVFNHCTISGKPGVLTYLGRPWRPYAATAFLNTQMSDVVRPVGWNNWRDPGREKTARYAEYNSSGPGAKSADRAPWARELSAKQAADYTIKNVFAGWQPDLQKP